MKPEFLQLAFPYNPKKGISLAGRFLSEKLDGLRAMWDGGITRGIPIEQVPWANIEKSNRVPKATGLWSRYGKPIFAEDWWLDLLPDFIIDGELWTGRQQFQRVSGIVRANVNQADWSPVIFKVLDAPHASLLFSDRSINVTNYVKNLRGCHEFATRLGVKSLCASHIDFRTRYKLLEKSLPQNHVVQLQEQIMLPFSPSKAEAKVFELMDQFLELGGEGVIVKSPNDIWLPERCHSMIKFKPYIDGEGTVIGYTTGRETDKGSKLLGLMGALVLRVPAGTFKVSGFTDSERTLQYLDGRSAFHWAAEHPDMPVPVEIESPTFPRGTVVTYKYRETTDAGLPKEARYWRKFLEV